MQFTQIATYILQPSLLERENVDKNKNETMTELAQSVRKLTRKAYPGAPPYLIDTLALDHFIDAIPDVDMKLRLREAWPRDLNAAESLAERLEWYR